MSSNKRSLRSAPAVFVERCSVRFGSVTVFENLSFTIPSGAIAAVIGPNGAGKSTLMRAMLGLVPYHGTIELQGVRPLRARSRMGYVPQRITIDRAVPLTVGEFLDLARPASLPHSVRHEALGEVGLNPAVMAAASFHTLSGGERQRVLIARAIQHRPDILFLDEPSSGIDIHGEQTFFEILHHLNREHGTTIILISHEVDLIARHVTQVLCLNHGLVCAGPTKTALTPDTIAQTFGPNYTSHQHHV